MSQSSKIHGRKSQEPTRSRKIFLKRSIFDPNRFCLEPWEVSGVDLGHVERIGGGIDECIDLAANGNRLTRRSCTRNDKQTRREKRKMDEGGERGREKGRGRRGRKGGIPEGGARA